MIKVTFSSFSKVLNKYFPEVETRIFKSIQEARLRALALNWTISKIEQL
jgi:hypothetical protein